MYIVTGGAGFIGSALVSRLNSAGITDILVVDNLGSSEKWKNLVGKTFQDYVHKSDFLKTVETSKNAIPAKAVIHLGACSSTTETDADYMYRNNFLYTRTLAEWCLEKQIPFVYASSAATYGDGSVGFSDGDETSEKLSPLNIYGYSKQLFDLWALKTGAHKKMVGLKFFNVFGPNEYHKGEMRSVVHKAFQQIERTGQVELFKSYRKDFEDGGQKRDFVYVKDCTEVIWWFLENRKVSGIYNLGTGKARSWKDLVASVFSALGREPKIKFIEMPQELQGKYQYFTEAEMTKLQKAGCKVQFQSLEHSVADYVKNYLATSKQYL